MVKRFKSSIYFFDTERYLGLKSTKTLLPACDAQMFIEKIGGNADYDIDKGVLAVGL